MKLKDSITSNSIKIIDLYNKVDSGVWDTSPDFQRKLVWKKQHKYAFISTILSNYPFPEIYIASEKMDVDSLKSQEIVVDGKQRVTAIVDYIKGIGDFTNSKKVKSFSELSTDEKRDFLNYYVTVKDLKDLDIVVIKDVFQRINSTDYSLNTNERLNARFGDGEFAMFCKQIVDPAFNPTNDETDIVIEKTVKNRLNNFFIDNNIFTDNDKNRMFNVQFIMLLVSTILEGAYFGRSNVVNTYIEKYNSNFSGADDILSKILKAVSEIEELKFSPNSYWFNKANLFILLVELSKIEESSLDKQMLEIDLLDLEKKVDIYFTDDDISMIDEEERKYFEYSRQGSNELVAREHRGKIIKNIITNSLITKEIEKNSLTELNLAQFKNKEIDFVVFKLTETGLNKRLMDAISVVRDFLKRNSIHDYDSQELGPDKKVQKGGVFIGADKSETKTTISFYRANGRGDYRIWFSELSAFAKTNDELALIVNNKEINVLNLTNINYTSYLN